MRALSVAVLTLAVGLLSGCESEENASRVRKLTQAETEEAIKQEQGALNERVERTEAAIRERHDVYEQFSGIFDATTAGAIPYRVKLITGVNLPRYEGTRVRTLEVVEDEFRKLALNLQIVVDDARFPGRSAVSCRFESVQPNEAEQKATVIRESCPNVFDLTFAHDKIQGTLYTASGEEIQFSANRRRP